MQAQLATEPRRQEDDGVLISELERARLFFFLARATDSSYDPTWLRLPLSWIQELASIVGKSGSMDMDSACHSRTILTEEDWVGACEDTLLPEVLPCLLATRLAWKRTNSGH